MWSSLNLMMYCSSVNHEYLNSAALKHLQNTSNKKVMIYLIGFQIGQMAPTTSKKLQRLEIHIFLIASNWARNFFLETR